MKNFVVTLTHTEVIEVVADNSNEALHKAYSLADANCFWDETYVDECDDEELDDDWVWWKI